MKVLVTGSSGQLARSLVERSALSAGVEVVAIGRPQLDLEIPGSAGQAIRRTNPDIVINAAALTDVDGAEEQQLRAQRINGEAAGEVAAAAAALAAPFIQISTDYVFDGGATVPYEETAPTRPINAYGRTKLSGEEAVRAANPKALIVRTAWVYSPFGRNFVKTMFEAANDRNELRVVADKQGSPTSALDLADGLLRLLGSWKSDKAAGQGDIYHVAGTGQASWFDLALEVMTQRRRLGLRAARLAPIPASDWPMRAVRPDYSVMDSTKFARDFGFVMPDWRRSVADVVGRLAARR